MAHADSTLTFRSKPGFTSSSPKMFMFGITTFMFVLGFIILVMETALGFQGIKLFLFDPTVGNEWSTYRANIVLGTFSRLTVRLHDNPVPSAPLNWLLFSIF